MARVVLVLGVLALLFFVERSLGERAQITLVNGGYEGMLVAIAESVPVSESEEMIRRIKVRIYPHRYMYLCRGLRSYVGVCVGVCGRM